MKRPLMVLALGVVGAILTVLAGVRLYQSSSATVGFASPATELACEIRTPDCLPGEVEMLRMSGPTNAHAGTPGASAYDYKLCCGGGVGNACSGHFDTMLTLWATDNAHVAVDGSYGTQVCLSAPETEAQCTYTTDTTCGDAYTCVATVSGVNNAHIADCDGVDDYTTKVCCTACDWSVPAGDPDVDWLTNAQEDKNGDGILDYDPDRLLTETDACELDTDGDGCADYEEWGSTKALGGLRHPVNPRDFYDITDISGVLGSKDKGVSGFDLNLMLLWGGAVSGGGPNANGKVYDLDGNTPLGPPQPNGIPDGVELDFASLAGPGTGPDDGISGFDLNQMLSEGGDSCVAPP